MAEIEQFLEPIPGDNPSGADLKYAPVYDQIREARRQEDSGPMGLWERDVKTADFVQVIKLGEDALLKKTKDLQIAAWLIEAWIYRSGLPGLISGLHLVQGLVERFWDTLYPELDEGDAEPRAAPLEWVGSYFDPSKGSSPILALRRIPLTKTGFDSFIYQESRKIGYEREVDGNEARTKARQQAIKEQKIVPEEFDKDFEATPKAFYKKLESDFKLVREAVHELDTVCRDKFADVAPSFTPLSRAIDEVANVAHILLLKKLEKEPDPPEPVAVDETAPDAGEQASQQQSSALPQTAAEIDLSNLNIGEIASPEQAILHVIAAAQFLRHKSPSSPVPYLLLRALRWGELRGANNGEVANLPAPSSDVRVTLKNSASGNNWKRVLETAEAAMSGTSGRAWLDLQRYAVKACEELGYTLAAKAIRSELKAFLTDFPTLATAILNDDTGAANPDTLNWLRQEGFIA